MTNATLGGYRLGSVALFAAIHLAVLTVFLVPFRWSLVAWLLGSYFLRMFGVTAGYHRYFSHRSYQLSRIPQFIMGFLAQTSGQKGVLWWASHHRVHHRNSDKENDIHSPARRGFFWSHVGWVISNDYDDYDEIDDDYPDPSMSRQSLYARKHITLVGGLFGCGRDEPPRREAINHSPKG
jgi:stearoyl-CoA desaturase (delta-9 desaturase)